MKFPLDRNLELKIKSSHPRLLEGLNNWLELGLISDADVRKVCAEYLVCYVEIQPSVKPTPRFKEPLIATLPPETPEESEPNFITSVFQSLAQELSVRWLLFLGLFLVVVSSGVLAASQWQRFPAIGQYGVLLIYTVGFGWFAFWAGKQNNLKLTAQTLLTVTLLLVPVNFWAMDSFSLWLNPLNGILMAIAGFILSVMTVILCKNRAIIVNFPIGKLPFVNILLLSYLHWGWKLPGFPLIAVYSAMIVTTIISIRNPPRFRRDGGEEVFSQVYIGLVISALLLLLLRAIFIAGVSVNQLGLAVGICGWLGTRLAKNKQIPAVGSEVSDVKENSAYSLWDVVGCLLLLLGWVLAIANQPLQAILICGLSLQFFTRHLSRYNLKSDFTAIFLIGLQTVWLIWRLVPAGLQELAINTGTHLTHTQNTPWALLSIALFPYIVLTLILTEQFHQSDNTHKQDLAIFGEQLTLILGVCLMVISTINPLLRSLNLVLSTITLYTITQRRYSHQPSLVYLSHITGLLTIFSLINWLSPHLGLSIWAGISLILMVLEWIFSLGRGIWQSSAWYIGFGLSNISFYLLLLSGEGWGIFWLITPVTLTTLAHRTSEQNRYKNAILSFIAVGISQVLTFGLPINRLIALAVGTGLMFINTRYLRNQLSALTTVGFGLSLLVALAWDYTSISIWFVLGSIIILSLWLGRTVSRRNRELGELAVLYAVAADKWAIALCCGELLGLILHSIQVYQGIVHGGIYYLIATALILVGIIYRTWREHQTWAFYSIGLCLELLTAEVIGFGEHSLIKLAIANIGLGLTSQFFGEWWRQRYQLDRLPHSFHVLPLVYSSLGLVFRSHTFTDWTGFCSLGVALVLIGVGRRSTGFKGLLYLGIIGVSISAYEFLIYQILQAKGGSFGDGLIVMSALGTGIMTSYRIFSPWLVSYLGLTRQHLEQIAHFHWVWSSLLYSATILFPIQTSLYLTIGTGLFLARYAIWQAREYDETTEVSTFKIAADEIWVYLGLLAVGILGIHLQHLSIINSLSQQSLPWRGAIACVVAGFLYILPWKSLGWSKTPWERIAFIIPLITICQTRLEIHPITLIITSAYYILLAKLAKQIRLSYISLTLVDWALFHWFYTLHITEYLWYITVIGVSLLFVIQVDEQLKPQNSRTIRHNLRIISSGLICGSAILFEQHLAFIPGIFSLIAIFAGLALRVRAYLYIGTAAFFTISINQLVILSQYQSFLKWVVGLVVGILLIYIAANFETRRTQIISLLRSIGDELKKWD